MSYTRISNFGARGTCNVSYGLDHPDAFSYEECQKKIHAKARLTENLVDNLTGQRVYRYNKHQLSVQNPFIRVIFHILKN